MRWRGYGGDDWWWERQAGEEGCRGGVLGWYDVERMKGGGGVMNAINCELEALMYNGWDGNEASVIFSYSL